MQFNMCRTKPNWKLNVQPDEQLIHFYYTNNANIYAYLCAHTYEVEEWEIERERERQIYTKVAQYVILQHFTSINENACYFKQGILLFVHIRSSRWFTFFAVAVFFNFVCIRKWYAHILDYTFFKSIY